MRITCEKCQAVYLIAQKIIGSKGRVVKCAKCSHCWNVNISQPYPSIKPNSGLKSAKYNASLKYIIALLVISNILCILCFFPEYLLENNFLQNIYSKFSIYDHKNIILEDFKIRKNKNDIIISGKLTNTSSQNKAFPAIRYAILDENEQIIMRLTTPQNGRMIKPYESLPINTKISSIKENSSYIQIDIGNKLDLLLR